MKGFGERLAVPDEGFLHKKIKNKNVGSTEDRYPRRCIKVVLRFDSIELKVTKISRTKY